MKTTELDRFAVLLDRHGIGRIPGIAFSIDLFGNDAGKKGWNLSDRATALLIDRLKIFEGFGLVIRADERTAKGVGLPGGTYFIFMDPKYMDVSIGAALMLIKTTLASQWDPTAIAYRKRTNLEDGLGILLMPFAGENFIHRNREMFGPIVSLKGMTILAKREIMMEVGFGIPETTISGRGTPNPVFNPLVMHPDFEIITGKFFKQGEIGAHEFTLDEFREFSLYRHTTRKIGEISHRMLDLAKEHGSDIYFELQSVDIANGRWVCTQITNQDWKGVEKPMGETILEVAGPDSVVGTGIVQCRGFDERIARIGRTTIEPANAGVLTRTNLILQGNFKAFSQAPALLLTRGNVRAFASHLDGMYRSAGVLLLNWAKRTMEMKYFTGECVVWVDEVNQIGGIVKPK